MKQCIMIILCSILVCCNTVFADDPCHTKDKYLKIFMPAVDIFHEHLVSKGTTYFGVIAGNVDGYYENNQDLALMEMHNFLDIAAGDMCLVIRSALPATYKGMML